MPNPKRLLERVEDPADIRGFTIEELNQLAAEIRDEVISVVSEVGGHFASTLGAVELTLALHYVFRTPEDRIIWDTGHQAYAHKLICGRRDRLSTIRQFGGLSGFLSREESEYDVFGAGHAGTSISAALGMVEAKVLEGSDRKVVAVISDGGLSAGLTYEGLNSAGHLDRDLIVVLNDNEHFIDPRVGAVSSFLSKQLTTNFGVRMQKNLSNLLKSLPSGENLKLAARKFRDSFLSLVTPGFLFESLGFQYVGPIDGHNIGEMIATLENVKKIEGPTLVHVLTKKGKGYGPAEADPIKFHGVTPFHVLTGKAKKEKGPIPTYTEVFGQSLLRIAKNHPKVVGITAAMGSGTGIDKLAREIPDRTYDVGIAEQHAVTFAAGLASEGMRPFAAIYSTFLQRAYDQVIHDVAVQNLPVRFAIDRAGYVGADGPTHAGNYDSAYLGAIPNMVVMAAADEAELRHMVATAAAHDSGPIAFRYPRGDGLGVELPEHGSILPIGKGRIVREGAGVALLSFGTRLGESLAAAEKLAAYGLTPTVADARFLKPLDEELIARLAQDHDVLITLEESGIGGFGSHVATFLAHNGLLDGKLKFRPLMLPDSFTEQASQADMYAAAGLDRAGIVATVLGALGIAEPRLVTGADKQR